jgi:hypothetical protein
MPCSALVQAYRPSCGRMIREQSPRSLVLRTMKSKSRNIKRDQQDDGWTWVVIGLIFGAVTLVLYGPFIWQMTHGSL